jgi:hypothetical protein
MHSIVAGLGLPVAVAGAAVPRMEHRLEYFGVVVPLVFTGSVFLCSIIDVIYNWLLKSCIYTYTKINSRNGYSENHCND